MHHYYTLQYLTRLYPVCGLKCYYARPIIITGLRAAAQKRGWEETKVGVFDEGSDMKTGQGIVTFMSRRAKLLW